MPGCPFSAMPARSFLISAIALPGFKPYKNNGMIVNECEDNDIVRRLYLGTGFSAVHNGVTSVDGEWISELIQTIFGALITRINHPSVGLHENSGAQVPIRIPPV